MKTLYFDIDGTVLLDNQQAVKPRLGQGEFETAIRSAGFNRMVCVGNFCRIAALAAELIPNYPKYDVLMNLCRGALLDADWVRRRTTFVEDAETRAAFIDLSGDWWYLDDLAAHYCQLAGMTKVYTANIGTRICAPAPRGDGADVLEWLQRATP